MIKQEGNYEELEFTEKLTEINQDLQMFAPYENKILGKVKIDLMFIVDCTASMTPWIQACREHLQSIIQFLQAEYKQAQLRVSFIGYRDFSEKQYQYLEYGFTQDYDDLKQKIKDILAFGGGDMPEDLLGGLNLALKQKWENPIRYAVILCDYPCHGKIYHELFDKYPEGDPNGLQPETLIKQFYEKGIQLYAIQITNHTNKMYQIFSKIYQKYASKPLPYINLGENPKSFGFFVACTLQVSIGSIVDLQLTQFKKVISILKDLRRFEQLSDNKKIMEQDKEQKQQQLEKEVQILSQQAIQPQFSQLGQQQEMDIEQAHFPKMVEAPNWKNLQDSQDYQAVCHTFFIVKDQEMQVNWKKPYIQKSQIKTKVRICKQTFSEGAMRFAFYGQDLLLNQNLVLKLEKHNPQLQNVEQMKSELEVTFICQHIMNEFNQRIIQYLQDSKLLLNFVHTFIYELEDKETQFKLYYGENFIEGLYEKYNNNAGWFNSNVSESSLISQCFSHFSWQITKGYLMIVDLQGVTGILTDPQIHCLDFKRFGKGNLGYEGIMKFFLTHQCNHYCQKLQLLNPKIVNQIPQDWNFFDVKRQYEQFHNNFKIVQTLCDICRKPFEIQSNIIYIKHIKAQEIYCNSCQKQKNATMKEGVCIDCKAVFRSSEFWFQMKRTDFPIRCHQCRVKLREEQRNKLNQEVYQEDN